MRRSVRRRAPLVGAAIAALLGTYFMATPGWSTAQVAPAAPAPAQAQKHDGHTHLPGDGHKHGEEMLEGRSGPHIKAIAPSSLVCDGNGQSGKRVQLVYLRGDGQPDQYNTVVGQFRQQASQVDAYINNAAQRTGGIRHVRYVHDASCNPIVDNQVVPQSVANDFLAAVRVLEGRGYNRKDRKYMIWYSGNDACGAAWGPSNDDRPGPENVYNSGPSYALVASSRVVFGRARS